MRPGNVPTERVGPVIERLVRERWPHGGGLQVLAEKVGCDVTAIESIIEQTNPGCSFDLADSLLCALGPGIRAWRGELEDVYYGAGFIETCALPGCGKQFPERQRGPKKRYCSERCQRAGKHVRRHGTPGMRYRARGRCLKGHLLTDENTYKSKGKVACKRCARERARAACVDPEARERKLASARRRYHARKAAA